MTGTIETAFMAISDDELTAHLEVGLHSRLGVPRDVRVAAITRRPCLYRSSFSLEEIDATLTNGKLMSLLVKDLSWDSLSPVARQAKPYFLFDPRRELFVYEHLLPHTNLRTPICFAAVLDESRQRFWVMMERLSGVELYQVGEFEKWRAVAGYLPQMHAQAAAAFSRICEQPSPLLSYDADYFLQWPSRAIANVTALADQAATEFLEQVAAQYGRVVTAIGRLPTGLIHGELYASHVIWDDNANPRRICPIDWELAGTGPMLLDLAALVSGKWTADERQCLAFAYYEVAQQTGAWQDSFDALLCALRFCRLHLGLQWLGWSSEWQPPPERAHDWLADVRRLSQQLGFLNLF